MASGWNTRGRGGRDYTDAQVTAVKTYLLNNCVGAVHVVKQERLAEFTGMVNSTRALRQLLSDIDGIDFVLGTGDSGVWIVEFYEESDRTSARLGSQVKTMTERIERRKAYTNRHLTRQQGRMFDEG